MKQNGLYLPSTFEERGTAAPFTTPLFVLSRVRPDERQGLVLLLPGFGGTEASYVVPWSAVREMGSMSVHDRALHEEIFVGRTVSPHQMRSAAFKVAATGLAGPLVAEAAQRAMAADQGKIDETHTLLILALLTASGMPIRELTQADPKTEEWRAKARAMLTRTAAEYGIGIEEVYHRIGELSRVLAPVGLAISKQEARLRQMLPKLGEFRQSIGDWAAQDSSEMAEYAGFASNVADHTLDLAGRMFRKLDAGVSDIGLIVREWEAQEPLARELADRLSWLLDGWETVIALWRSLAGQPVGEQRDGVANLVRVLPLIPRKEGEEDDEAGELARAHETFRHRRLQPYVDWRTGKYDIELVSRIERIKAAAVA